MERWFFNCLQALGSIATVFLLLLKLASGPQPPKPRCYLSTNSYDFSHVIVTSSFKRSMDFSLFWKLCLEQLLYIDFLYFDLLEVSVGTRRISQRWLASPTCFRSLSTRGLDGYASVPSSACQVLPLRETSGILLSRGSLVVSWLLPLGRRDPQGSHQFSKDSYSCSLYLQLVSLHWASCLASWPTGRLGLGSSSSWASASGKSCQLWV